MKLCRQLSRSKKEKIFSISSRLIIERFAKNEFQERELQHVTCVPTATSLECHNKLFPTALSLSFSSVCVVRDFTGIWPNYLFINQLDWNNAARESEWVSEWVGRGVEMITLHLTLGLSYIMTMLIVRNLFDSCCFSSPMMHKFK